MSYCREAIAAMSGYVPGEQPRDRGYIKLNTNENPYPPSPRVLEALERFDGQRLRLYPDPLASALRGEAGRLFGLGPDWVVCGNGSDDLLTMALRTYVGEGDSLACFEPSYSLYPVLAQIQGVKCVEIALDESFGMPSDVIAQAKDCRLLFVTRPNAPTGNAFPKKSVEKICRDFPGIVWIDEAYADFGSDHCVDLVRDHSNVIVSRTFSKSYSLAGVRLGLAFANPDRIGEMLKVKDSYNVNMLTQEAGLAALRDQTSMRANVVRVRATREATAASLRQLGFGVCPSDANFLFVKPPICAASFVQSLREHGILVRYFGGPRTGHYVRITIGTDEEMAALVEATRRILND